MENLLLVFAKEPKAGLVKTRLAKDIGDELAKKVYEAFLTDIALNVRDDESYDLQIVCTPESDIANLNALLDFDNIMHQQGDTLTERLSHAFGGAFYSGYKRVLAIGTDAPFVNRFTIRESIALLTDADCVIGPATDGGYYLIGMNKFVPEIFSGISWSTKKVFHETMQKVEALGLTASIMKEMSDVDNYNDLISLENRFENLTEHEKKCTLNLQKLFSDITFN